MINQGRTEHSENNHSYTHNVLIKQQYLCLLENTVKQQNKYNSYHLEYLLKYSLYFRISFATCQTIQYNLLYTWYKVVNLGITFYQQILTEMFFLIKLVIKNSRGIIYGRQALMCEIFVLVMCSHLPPFLYVFWYFTYTE